MPNTDKNAKHLMSLRYVSKIRNDNSNNNTRHTAVCMAVVISKADKTNMLHFRLPLLMVCIISFAIRTRKKAPIRSGLPLLYIKTISFVHHINTISRKIWTIDIFRFNCWRILISPQLMNRVITTFSERHAKTLVPNAFIHGTSMMEYSGGYNIKGSWLAIEYQEWVVHPAPLT